jgi:hypothetical protein
VLSGGAASLSILWWWIYLSTKYVLGSKWLKYNNNTNVASLIFAFFFFRGWNYISFLLTNFRGEILTKIFILKISEGRKRKIWDGRRENTNIILFDGKYYVSCLLNKHSWNHGISSSCCCCRDVVCKNFLHFNWILPLSHPFSQNIIPLERLSKAVKYDMSMHFTVW